MCARRGLRGETSPASRARSDSRSKVAAPAQWRGHMFGRGTRPDYLSLSPRSARAWLQFPPVLVQVQL